MVGSKKKKNKRNPASGSRTGQAARSSRPDMSKYAGAVSNKSNWRYIEERPSEPSPASVPAERPKPKAATSSGGASKTSASQKGASKKGTTQKQSPKKHASKKGTAPEAASGGSSSKKSGRSRSSNPASAGLTGGSKGKRPTGKPDKKSAKAAAAGNPQTKPSASPKPAVKPQYEQDDYSRALNGSDFYSSAIKKFYMKYPEMEEEIAHMLPSPGRNVKSRKQRKNAQKGAQAAPKPSTGKSVAAIAVEHRGKAATKRHARVVQKGKARGVVTTRAAHRKVRRRNRRHSAVFNSVVVMAVVAFLFAMYVNVFFKVKHIEVEGKHPYNETSITELCGFSDGDNILFIDAPSSEKIIVEQLPYIEQCIIKRRLPATVVVKVTEAQPLGIAELGENRWCIVSTKGKLLKTVTTQTAVSSSDVTLAQAQVSASDAPSSTAALSSYTSIADKARTEKLPLLLGLPYTSGEENGYLNSTAIGHLDQFVDIMEMLQKFNWDVTCLKVSDRGYEVQYDGRINVVLGELADKPSYEFRLTTADYIIRASGDVTDRDKGEITFIKNQAFYNPFYEIDDGR